MVTTDDIARFPAGDGAPAAPVTGLVTHAPPRNHEAEAAKARALSARRLGG